MALPLFYIVEVTVAFGVGDFESNAERVFWLVAGLLSGAVMLLGLSIERTDPRTGGIVTVVGALPLGLFMFWAIFPPIIATVVAVLTIRRTRAVQAET